MIAVGFNGSPVKGSNCEILLKKVLEGAESEDCTTAYFHLNDLDILACQSCGESPYPGDCFFHDGMDEIYRYLIEADIIVTSSPVYFDSVSTQLKSMIDRCNCFRPAIFPKEGEEEPERVKFLHRDFKHRKGLIILSGGQRQKFACARTVIKSLFEWLNIEYAGELNTRGSSLKKGIVIENESLMQEAFQIGKYLASQRPSD